MMTLSITGLYAGLLALLFIGLSIQVIRLRFRKGVGLGDGGVSELNKAIRIHGNFAEYIPLALLLMALLEINGGSELWLHTLGGLLFVGRALHAIGLSKSKGTTIQRASGTIVTQLAIAGSSLTLIINFLS